MRPMLPLLLLLAGPAVAAELPVRAVTLSSAGLAQTPCASRPRMWTTC